VDVRGGGLLRFDEGGHLTYAALKTVMDPERQQAKYAAWDAEREGIPTEVKGTFHRVSGA
jgi:hypothetical protein